MRLSPTLVLASTNRHKLEEFQALFFSYPNVEIRSAADFIRNPEGLQFAERHDTYAENAVAKARLVNQACHYPSLADDSGLEVEGLGGRPGVRSHRYASPRAGLTQDQANQEYLLKELASPETSRVARFVCHLALVVEGVLLQSTGVLDGTILAEARGRHGFGYDPLFLPRGSSKTLAEMTAGEKNSISHRARALADLMGQVKRLGIVLAKP
jgi:XTP/dITP diphosphohydrolase